MNARPHVLGRTATRNQAAFTLLEVMVATAVLFACVFAILAVVATGLKGARVLQEPEVDITALAGMLSLTNRVSEGSTSGDFEEIAPGLYPDWRWERDVYEVSTNGLFKVDFLVTKQGSRAEQRLSILLYRPDSQSGPFGGRTLGR
jgi:Tfp pilus assembly protein PilV